MFTEWLLDLFGRTQSSPVVVASPGPWNILWGGEICYCKAEYDESWGGNPFFVRRFEIDGHDFSVEAMKMATGSRDVHKVWIWIYPQAEELRGRVVNLEVGQDGGWSLAIGEWCGSSVSTTDLKEAIIEFARMGKLDHIFKA